MQPTFKSSLTYIGHLDWLAKTFAGTWEILTDDDENKEGNIAVAGAGKWKMSKA